MGLKDAEKQCDVTFDQIGYTVISDRAYGNTLQPSDLNLTNLLTRKRCRPRTPDFLRKS